MRCPACKVQLTVMKYEGANVYHCGTCGGNMVNEQRLERICDAREINMPEAVRQKMMDIADEHHRPEKLWCMSCGTEMDRIPFKFWNDIQIDRCPKCRNIWLDKGELEKCQIYWEYMQDNPEQWGEGSAFERRAALDAELVKRKADLQEEMDFYRERRYSGLGSRYGGAGFLIGSLFRLFGR
jgi:Zn-finger nucleic acid-binding protein